MAPRQLLPAVIARWCEAYTLAKGYTQHTVVGALRCDGRQNRGLA